MVDSAHRPIGDDDEQVGAVPRRRSEMLGEPQVVADERGDAQPRPRKRHDRLPGRVDRRLTAEGEGLELAVGCEERSVGIKRQRLVGRTAGNQRHQPADHGAPEPPGQVAEKRRTRVGIGRRSGDVEAESGKRHLGEDDQIARPDRNLPHKLGDPLPVGRRILPSDVKLHEMNVHRDWLPRESIHHRSGGPRHDVSPVASVAPPRNITPPRVSLRRGRLSRSH